MTEIIWPEPGYAATDTWWKSWKLTTCPHFGTAIVQENNHGHITEVKKLIIPEYPTAANAVAVILYGGWRIKHQHGHSAVATSPTGVETNFYVPTHHDFLEKNIVSRGGSWKQLEQIDNNTRDNVDNLQHYLKATILFQSVTNILPLITDREHPQPPSKEWAIDLLGDPVWRGALDAIADMHARSPDARFS